MITVKDFHYDNLFTNSSVDISSEVEGKHSTELFTQVFVHNVLKRFQDV